MRQNQRFLLLGFVGMALFVWGIYADQIEAAMSGIATIVAGALWDYSKKNQISGDDVINRWTPSGRMLKIITIVIVLFFLITAWGVYRDIIPFGLVAVMIAFISATPIIAAPYLFVYWIMLAKAKAADGWPETVGKVVTSDMVGGPSVWSAPMVVYTYSVDGTDYRRSRVRFGGTGASNPADAEQILAAYPVGAEVPVFYDPKKPGRSVLLPSATGPNKGLLWGAGLSAGATLLGALAIGLLILLGLIDAALTAIVGHRVLP